MNVCSKSSFKVLTFTFNPVDIKALYLRLFLASKYNV